MGQDLIYASEVFYPCVSPAIPLSPSVLDTISSYRRALLRTVLGNRENTLPFIPTLPTPSHTVYPSQPTCTPPIARWSTLDEPGKYADKNSQIGEIILFSADLQQFEEQMTERHACLSARALGLVLDSAVLDLRLSPRTAAVIESGDGFYTLNLQIFQNEYLN
ncbi:uncharacterized protein H6S33_013128 [Morchella sextelata]|uniref:uncharacterized protein n=1 Tax=Morchella sextelata TaxID=1174677 RepID=UPI001D03C031|nr:uncharacterized protein H6S33_013128 [Morchella sextelata]KAH0609642.1 hypothetical protein H6S33_013128 [Morchella sextelata]